MFKKFSKFFLFLSDDILPIMPSLTAHTAIILISLYQLLIYLSLISAITSLSLCQHFIFISANTLFFHLRGQNSWHNQTQEKFYMVNIYTGLYRIYTAFYRTYIAFYRKYTAYYSLSFNLV